MRFQRGGRARWRFSPGDRTVILDRQIMAEALAIEQRHENSGPRYIAEQIGAVALRGDVAGIARWKAIAAAFDTLRIPGPRQ